tara:strand:- start:2561 stop:2710 length:150 start_codon:yes stop_codon:yes gene_type:complete
MTNATTTERKQPERQKIIAERINGQLAMLGLVAASFSYITTGHMFFGVV